MSSPYRLPSGPSPRGWGELVRQETPLGLDRTIPTRVGRTGLCSQRFIATADHPHAGGENSQPTSLEGSSGGPSPRGWGEQDVAG